MKRALTIVALVLIGAGLAQMFISKAVKPTTVRVLTALVELPAGSMLTQGSTGWAEVEPGIAAGYVRQIPAEGLVLLETLGRGELVPLRAVGSEPNANRSIVTIKPLVSPVRELRIGDVVDVWAKSLAGFGSASDTGSESSMPAPTMVATMARVVAVSSESAGIASAARTFDIAIDRDQLLGAVTAALDSQTVLAVVRTPSLASDRKS
jgi:uncharacterized protein